MPRLVCLCFDSCVQAVCAYLDSRDEDCSFEGDPAWTGVCLLVLKVPHSSVVNVVFRQLKVWGEGESFGELLTLGCSKSGRFS